MAAAADAHDGAGGRSAAPTVLLTTSGYAAALLGLGGVVVIHGLNL